MFVDEWNDKHEDLLLDIFLSFKCDVVGSSTWFLLVEKLFLLLFFLLKKFNNWVNFVLLNGKHDFKLFVAFKSSWKKEYNFIMIIVFLIII